MTELDHWHLPLPFLPLEPNQAHIWCASLDLPTEQVIDFQQLLCADEIERARRFVFDWDRRRYTVARGILRTLLGAYLAADARTIEFEYSLHGKPFLSSVSHPTPLFFNIAHSHEIAVYGMTCAGRIGIDVEHSRRLDNLSCLAACVFSASELAVFRSLPDFQRHTAFFNCWTRKEAFIKAVGDGLSYPLRCFDVSLAPGQPALLLRVQDDLEAHRCWQMAEFTPALDYVGAVVVEAKTVEVSFRRLDVKA